MKASRHFLLMSFLLISHILFAQNYRAEYFFDKDPGIGSGSNLPLTYASTDSAAIVSQVVATTGLASGFHNLFIRLQQADGSWGIAEGRPFFIENSALTAPGVLSKAEYFFDKDPGVGNGTPLPLATLTNDSAAVANQAIPLVGLTTGFHNLFIRLQQANGSWGIAEGRPFFIENSDPSVSSALSAAEYFFDKDPGVGSGTALPLSTLTNDSTAVANGVIAITGLPMGFHNLFIRIRQANGGWGIAEGRPFFIEETTSAAIVIDAAEYFIDKDPGVGKGRPLSINAPLDTISLQNAVIYTGCLTDGQHFLFARVRSTTGRWAIYAMDTFTVAGNSGFISNAALTTIKRADVSACGTSANEEVLVTVKNNGTSSIPAGLATVNLEVSGINTGNYTSINTIAIAPNDSAVVSLTGVNLGGIGTRTLTAILNLCGNTANSDDTLRLDVITTVLATRFYADTDGDGYGSTIDTVVCSLTPPVGYVALNGDCNDANAMVYPNATEICDGVDNNCDGLVDNAPVPNFQLVAPASTLTCTTPSTQLRAEVQGAGSYTYLWSNGTTGLSITAGISGTYAVTVTGGNGCTATKSVAISVDTLKPNPSINASKALICEGEATTLTAYGGSTYLWSTGATTAQIQVTPSVSSTFSVTVTGSNGCSTSTSKFISVNLNDPLGAVANRLPVNGSVNLPSTVELNWLPVENAESYDVLYWDNSNPSALLTHDAGNTPRATIFLQPYKTYSWVVRSKNVCSTRLSDTLSLTTRGIPDLVIDSVTISQPIKEGKTITVSYRVRNQGTYTTGSTSWKDRIWLSVDEDLRAPDDILLVEIPNQTYLLAGQTYTQTQTVTLPERFVGIYHLFFITDNKDASCITLPCTPTNRSNRGSSVTESNEVNNYVDTLITIEFSPMPNFVADTVLANPSVLFGGDTLTVTWQISNQGTANFTELLNYPYEKPWTDSIYISKKNFLDNTATVLYSVTTGQDFVSQFLTPAPPYVPQNYVLGIDSSITQTARYLIPPRYNGQYYVHLRSDFYDDVYEGGLEEDNEMTSDSIQILVKTPSDLDVTALTVPDSVFSGQNLNVSWTVANESATETNVTGWVDNVYLSKATTFNVDSCTLINSFFRSGRLDGGQTYNAQTSKTLANNLQGDFYVYVYTDYGDNVHEWGGASADYNLNNVRRSVAKVRIKLSNFPDLTPTLLSVDKTSIAADSSFNVTFSVKNVGNAPTTTGFDCYFSLVHNASFYAAAGFGQFAVDTLLRPGDSTIRTLRLTAMDVVTNSYRMSIDVDLNGRIYEQNETNNRRVSSPVTFVKRPTVYCDLTVSSLSTTGSAISGGPLSINSVLQNIGQAAANTLYYDVVISDNTIFGDAGDYYLLNTYAGAALEAGLTVNNNATVTLPNGVSGAKYLIARIQSYGTNPDNNLTNNTRIIPLSIALASYPDLVITAFTADTQAYAGQRVKLYYTVQNNGNTSLDGQFYLGAELTTAPTSRTSPIGTGVFNGLLPVGSSHSDSMFVTLPTTFNGSYFLNLHVDYSNEWYEYTGESNNRMSRQIYLLPVSQSEADLIVKDVTATRSALQLGERDTFNFKVVNTGTVATSGNSGQAVYLSNNNSFSLDDRLISASSQPFLLNAGDSATVSLSSVMQDKEGNFYPIGRTNVQGSVPEGNLENNTTAALTPIAISTKILPLSIWDATTINNDQPRYYKINVAAGKDLRIMLEPTGTSVGTSIVNQLYVAFNRVPSAQDYDVISEGDATNPIALLPSTQAGSYYLLIRAEVPLAQTVRVRADALEFSLDSVSPGTVGKGIVTTLLTGAGYRYNTNGDTLLQTRVYLKKLGATVSVGKLTKFISTMQMDIRWDLTDVAVGTYDVVLVNPNGVVVTFADGIKVEVAKPYDITTQYRIPDIIRVGRPTFWTIDFVNTGNLDVPFSEMIVSTPSFVNISNLKSTANAYYNSEVIRGYNSALTTDDWQKKNEETGINTLLYNMRPRERASISFKVGDLPEGTFNVNINSTEYDKDAFIFKSISRFDSYRKGMLELTDSFSTYPEFITRLNNKKGVIDSLMQIYIRNGFFTQADVDRVFANGCATCATLYAFDPSTAVGRDEQVSTVEFAANKRYKWEIAVPFGKAGNPQGWDLVTTTGQLNITATPQYPFLLDVQSVNPRQFNKDLLTTFEAWHDYRWAIAHAQGGITGFSPDKFLIKDSLFRQFNRLWGGHFEVELTGDSLFLLFKSRPRIMGEAGVDGNRGLGGYPGGNGGLGGLSAKGGDGGDGSDADASYTASIGGNGGTGGTNGDGGKGGKGGKGTCSGNRYAGANGGNGGDAGANGTFGGVAGLGGKSINYGFAQCSNPDFIPSTGNAVSPNGTNGISGIPTPPSPPQIGDTDEEYKNTFSSTNILLEESLSGVKKQLRGRGGRPRPCGIIRPPADNCGDCDDQKRNCQRACNWGFGLPIAGCTIWGVAGAAATIATFGLAVPVPVAAAACATGATILLAECRDDCDKKFADCGKVDPKDRCKPIQVTRPCDPNEISGNQGIDTVRWVSHKDTLAYQIKFENDSLFANTAAQRVVIRQKLDSTVNPLKVRLGEFGFANQRFTPPTKGSSFITRLNLGSTLGVDVEVSAGLDIANREVFWTFQSLQVGKNVPPYDPLIGMLPVNDSIGTGEGFVTYTILPRSNSKTRDSVLAEAGIYFDVNPPVITNVWNNLIDAVAPTSHVQELPYQIDTTLININFVGTDDNLGSGVDYYQLYVSDNVGGFKLTQTVRNATSTTFTGVRGHTYAFYSIAVDKVGNTEGSKTGAETIVYIKGELKFTEPLAYSKHYVGDSLIIQWTSSDIPKINISGRSLSSPTVYFSQTYVQNKSRRFAFLVPTVTQKDTMRVIIQNADFGAAADTLNLILAPKVINLSAKVFLQGAYNPTTGLMTENLQTLNLVPLIEPYTGMTGFTHVNGNSNQTTTSLVLASFTGNNAIIDWVFLEIRDSANPAQVVATQSVLLQKNGSLVNVQGNKPVLFNNIRPGNYYVAVRHRNHLGCMTRATANFESEPEPNIDFTAPSVLNYGTNAQRTSNSVNMLWSGDINHDGRIKYNGSSNDKNLILQKVGATTPNGVVNGYHLEDLNLDGRVKYNGSSNDKNIILQNVGATSPNAIITEQLPK